MERPPSRVVCTPSSAESWASRKAVPCRQGLPMPRHCPRCVLHESPGVGEGNWIWTHSSWLESGHALNKLHGLKKKSLNFPKVRILPRWG